jgi:hypothetical protein
MRLCSSIVALCLASSAVAQSAGSTPKQTTHEAVSQSLLAVFDTHPLVALGEWHDSKQDRELKIDLLRQPGFADKVQNIVLECGNSLYQDTLDRYVKGKDIPREQIQRVWRDTTQSPIAGTDFSACESVVDEVRSINRKLADEKKLRVLAGDPPIDWTKVKTKQDLMPYLQSRDSSAATITEHEVLAKHQRALLLYGAGHIWRKIATTPTPNLATILDMDYPEQLFTVIRLSGRYPDTEKLEALISTSDRPIFLKAKGTPVGALDANEFIGRDIPVKLFPPGLGIGEVVDACVYSGTAPDENVTPHTPTKSDPAWDAEQNRRRALAPGRPN